MYQTSGTTIFDPRMPHFDPRMPFLAPKCPFLTPRMPLFGPRMGLFGPRMPPFDPPNALFGVLYSLAVEGSKIYGIIICC